MNASQLDISLSPDLVARLLETASREGLPPETVATAVWALLLNRYTGDDTIVLSPSAPPVLIDDQATVRDWLKSLGCARSLLVCVLDGPQPLLRIPYDSTIFNEYALGRIPDYFRKLIGEIHSRRTDPVGTIEMLPEEDRKRFLFDWNQTATAYPEQECVHEQFERQAAATWEKTALIFRNQTLGYGELNHRANQLARRLMQLGVGPETLVGISLERSVEMVIALLAVLKVGGAYVPLDPGYPPERLKMILADAQPKIVLTQDRLAAQLRNEAQVLCVDSEWPNISGESPEPIGPRAAGHNVVYVIYTSGSTGKPKGVMIEHRNVVSFFTAMDLAIRDTAPGVWLAVTSISFDISVLELFWTLTRGFTVVVQADDGPRHIDEEYSIARNIRAHGVTHLQCTPSLLRILLSDRESVQALGRLQKLFLGGEALPASLAMQAKQLVPRLYNMYGPTETTIWSTTHVVEANDDRGIPIGRPIANTRTYILDRRLRPVPAGAAGELYIAGAGVVRGYLHHPDLTAERFMGDPFSVDPAARMYRTGDLARQLPDGAIEFLGRTDFQVKIRGYRIELGEIETLLERAPGVRQAVVVARENKPGDKRLVAYLVPDSAAADLGRLRSDLRESLPEYMQPAAYVMLEAMPLTANGKIDRKALPAPESLEPLPEVAYQAPKTSLQRQIADLWKEALDVEHVSIHDNFFDLGAHSLLVAEVHGKLSELLGREIPLVTMFRYPTIRSLASHLRQPSTEGSSLKASAARALARRKFIQRRIISG